MYKNKEETSFFSTVYWDQDPGAEAPAGRAPWEPSLELTGVEAPASPTLLGAHKRFFRHLGLEIKIHWRGRMGNIVHFV